jgi:mycothiol synthase
MIFTTVEPVDLAELVSLLNRSWEFDQLDQKLLEEKLFGDIDFNQDLCIVARQPSPVGLIQAVLRPGSSTGVIKFLGVCPSLRRRGLASQLLEQTEAKLKQLGAQRVRIGESAPNYLQPGLDIRYTPGLVMLEKRGYQKVGETYNLHCTLADRFDTATTEEISLRTKGIVIERCQSPELLLQFIQRFFPAWTAEVKVMLANTPASVHLARQDEDILGFAGYDGNNLGTGWFGPMGTHPERRGLGIGAVLYKRVLQDFQQQGLTACTIPWVGPYGFYAAHSPARLDRVFWRLEKAL